MGVHLNQINVPDVHLFTVHLQSLFALNQLVTLKPHVITWVGNKTKIKQCTCRQNKNINSVGNNIHTKGGKPRLSSVHADRIKTLIASNEQSPVTLLFK